MLAGAAAAPAGSSVTFSQCDGGVLGVDGVQDPFVADLGLRNEADFAAEVGRPAAHGVFYGSAVLKGNKTDGSWEPCG